MVVTVGQKDPENEDDIIFHPPCNGVKKGSTGPATVGGCKTVMNKGGFNVAPKKTKIAGSYNMGDYKIEQTETLGDPNDKPKDAQKQTSQAESSAKKAKKAADKAANEERRKAHLAAMQAKKESEQNSAKQ
ncbi:unnamed protein product [Clonostachys rosea f. rosea IK726]|uniref:Uncharacterized protein n=1 Tax=Clonostachys rosea f. rosea IK726 TaxID=1349383 RepID=A0ACA9UTL7_BIOOC|nr:unnamed protein product [Clonostachys rosea f. rosea IK726]